MGDPNGLDDLEAAAPEYSDLQWNTVTAYPDFDASPTKAWMIHHRNEPPVRPLFELAFGKRPGEELYDLTKDPDYMRNVAEDPAYKQVKEELRRQLMDVLREQQDPRVVESPCRFEHAPYAGE